MINGKLSKHLLGEADKLAPDMKVPAHYMAVLRLYQEAASHVLPNHYSADCCVNATRVAMAVLKPLGIDLVPTTVIVEVMNAAFWDLVSRGELADSPAWKEMDAHSVATSTVSEGDGWGGHLVGVYEEVILDSSTWQFCRPDKKIVLDPVTLLMFEDQRWPVNMSNEVGTFMHYEPHEPDRDFKKLPGFQLSKPNMLVADNILKMMKRIKHTRDARA